MESAPGNAGFVALENSEVRMAEESGKLAAILPNELYVYREDVVQCRKWDGMPGVVIEVAGDSDSDASSSNESDEEDDGNDNVDYDGNDNGTEHSGESGEESDSLADGQARIMWADGSETMNNISDVTVVDRGFLHGDIVASVADPTGQLGFVMDTSIMVDLLSPDEVIKAVSSRDLKCIREFTIGDYVVHGHWLGRVSDVLDNVTVLFDDGSDCIVKNADPLQLKPVSKSIVDDTDLPYYPGQRVRAASSSVFTDSRWLFGLWKSNRLEGTVTKVQAGSVFVHWIASSNAGIDTNSVTAPSEEQNPKNLTKLSAFTYANWQLGEWCLFSPSQVAPSSSSCSTFSNTVTKDLEDFIGGGKSGNQKDIKNDLVNENKDVISTTGFTERSKLDSHDKEVPGISEPDETVSDEQCRYGGLKSLDALDDVDSEHFENGFSANSSSIERLDRTFQSCQASAPVNLGIASQDDENRLETSTSPTEPGSSSSSSASKEPFHESWYACRKRLHKVFSKKKDRIRDETFDRALSIVNITTKVDVAWQDGTRELGLDSKSLIPIYSPGDHEFFPEQYVVEKASNESEDSSEVKRVGIIRSVNSKERTAHVRWLKPVFRPEDPHEFDNEEVVSAYELDVHPDYDYCYGDVVVRLSPVSADADHIPCESFAEEEQGVSAQVENETSRDSSGYDIKHAFDGKPDVIVSQLSWVGHITGLQDGDIEVTWADGMVSKVGPQAIYVVGREDDEETIDEGSDGGSWETVEEDEIVASDTAGEESSLEVPTDIFVEREARMKSFLDVRDLLRSWPLSAGIRFFLSLASSFLFRGHKETALLDSDNKGMNGFESQENTALSAKEPARSVNECNGSESSIVVDHGCNNSSAATEEYSADAVAIDTEVRSPSSYQKPVRYETDAESTRDYDRDGSCNFKHFDITEDPHDHHFLGEGGQPNGGRTWLKKVQKEWSILEKNLPDAIYVRAFEDRMDLLRAVIVGACGTPYQDGLFFFDFYLPPEYPQVPPSTYYRSGGLRINPNLYEEGKVCLSLLNTWTGKGNEVWDPSSSTILQVLVSLQGLVLNSKPYFNEAGYEKQIGTIEGEKNSLPYNENTFLLNLKSMMYLLRRPPVHFEEFVKDHFRRCGHYILKACDAYMKGCLVGTLSKDACMSDKSNELSSSVGFKLMLAKIMPKLFLALSEVGADCSQFEHLWKL